MPLFPGLHHVDEVFRQHTTLPWWEREFNSPRPHVKATVLYSVDNTTKTDIFDGVKISVQLFGDGRGIVAVCDNSGNSIHEKYYAKVYTIDRELQ